MTRQSADTPATYPRDELAADLRELIRSIETLHADPFIGYDSRTALHAQAEHLIEDLPERMTVEAFYQYAAPLVAGLDDAHSVLRPPTLEETEATDHTLPLSLRVVDDGLHIESVADHALTNLLGARLRAIEGIPIAELVDRCQELRGAENRFGALFFTANRIHQYRPLTRLLDTKTLPEILTFEFELDGHNQSLEIEPVSDDTTLVARLDQTIPYPEGHGPRYQLYEDGDAALFVPGNLSNYRESIEAKLATDTETASELASQAYDRHVGGNQPDSLEETVAALPSMTDTLASMAEKMAAADTRTLLIDLRDNPGGDSQFVFHLAYLLGGWEGIARATDGVKVVKRRTEPYQERYGRLHGELPIDNPADYDFTGFRPHATNGDEPPPLVQQLLAQSQTATEFVEQHDDSGLYEPAQVVVVVSAGTMSSAFACAAQLTALGANIVGVPPGQAPISFGEHIENLLPHTGLKVRLAGSLYHWLDEPTNNILEPNQSLTPQRFKEYGYAADANLRLAFEYAGYTDSPPTPVE